ncbi:MAG: hypothetical protein JWL62_1714 [Hyphomicrobiales bacterium]|nr:hypothetical protein [Hyphomicrobiales bacterium]
MSMSRAWGLTRLPHSRSGYKPDSLTHLCCTGLRRTLNPLTALYDRQIRHGRLEMTEGTEDLTSTCICLIGIDRAKVDPAQIGLAPQVTLDAAIDISDRRRYAGGLGLLIWANAVLDGVAPEELLLRAGLPIDDIGRFTAPITTMEVAWLASGLLHELARSGRSQTRRLAQEVVAVLRTRFDETTGLMRHASPDAPLSHRLRANIANFADQTYSAQAFAFAAMVLEDRLALARASRLAARLTGMQGPLGQWWWHYDAARGDVAEMYPVYSVHQYGMAPMALSAVHAAGGPDFGAAVTRSHAWLSRNELGIDMVDSEARTIWRDIERAEGRTASAVRKSLALVGHRGGDVAASEAHLRLNRETRPYEWAWCLYASSIASGADKGRHLL